MIFKRILSGIIFGVGLVTIAVGGFRFFWPIVDAKGEITSGTYRGIAIGQSKSDVEIAVMIPGRQKLKLFGYVGKEGRTESILTTGCRDRLDKSSTWYLNYPGVHNEVVQLTFEDDRVVRIEYERDMLSP